MSVPGQSIYLQAGIVRSAAVTLIAAFVLTFISGCSIIRVKTGPEDFGAAEKSLTESINTERDASVLSGYYLRRARLRLRADNPHIYYEGAYKDLKAAVQLEPDLSKKRDINDWMAALGRISDLDRDATLAERQNRTLRSNIDQLEKHEQELRKTIEDLQLLELQREQRRQLLR